MYNFYTCPYCGNEDDSFNYHSIKIEGKKLSSQTQIKGRLMTTTTTRSVFHVKQCNDCFQREAKQSNTFIIILGLTLVVNIIRSIYIYSTTDFTFGSLVGLIIGGSILLFITLGIINWLALSIYNSIKGYRRTVNYKTAKENNALVYANQLEE